MRLADDPDIRYSYSYSYSMTSSEAKREFQIRYYLWAVSEFEKEIAHSFENFLSFKTGSVWRLHKFMRGLQKQDQSVLAHSLLKRFHPEAVCALSESCSSDERSLRDKLDVFRLEPSGPEFEVAARRGAGEKFRFVSKRKLLRVTAETFQNAFGDCVESDRDEDYDPNLQFRKSCGEWVIYTHFWFGRREPLISYSHGIATDRIFEQKGEERSYHAQFSLAFMISFCSWLGISSQTHWEFLLDEDLEVACRALIKHCGRFFEAAPKLLKGLEIDTITDEQPRGV